MNVPSRATRQQSIATLNVLFARVNTVKEGKFLRLSKQFNRLVTSRPDVDIFNDRYYSFHRAVKLHAASS